MQKYPKYAANQRLTRTSVRAEEAAPFGPTLTTSHGRKNIIKTHRIWLLSSPHEPPPSPIRSSGNASGLHRRKQPANEMTNGSRLVPPILHELHPVHRTADQKHIDFNETRHIYSVYALWTEHYN